MEKKMEMKSELVAGVRNLVLSYYTIGLQGGN